MSTYFTIGHGTRPIAEFVKLLQQAKVRLVADVRSIPRSRTNPQYHQERLPSTLAPFEIAYRHLGALGGRRHKAPGIAPETNGFWHHDSFHNFADDAMSEAFRAGLAQLRQLGNERRCAIMCAETLWWRCHRRIVADYLIAAGDTVPAYSRSGACRACDLDPGRTPSARSHACVSCTTTWDKLGWQRQLRRYPQVSGCQAAQRRDRASVTGICLDRVG